ncbi:mitochondrial carrier domain-containing protein [Chytriomyces sp. MP71]|nr:mitochondrial carrier domain-containing protein [Chytriomyces sp. MP71]
MAHSEKRAHWLKEGAIGLGTGILYGVTSVTVGHPFDTIKTKMQAQHGHVEGGGMISSFKRIWFKEGGFWGLYRGVLPPMLGSGVYRSVQFAVYEGLYTKWDSEGWRAPVPATGGIQARVFAAGFAASFVRACIESPIELAKVKGQTGQSWHAHELTKGFPLQLARTSGVMVTYFALIDSIRRHAPRTFDTLWGQFLASSCSATVGFWVVWPFEVLKNQVQADMPVTVRGAEVKRPTLMQRARYLVSQHGVMGLYRGIWPGTLRSMVSNGFSMVMMLQAQKKITEWGWRN